MGKVVIILISAFLFFQKNSVFSQPKEAYPYVVGICYVDLNANGLMDSGEPPLKNIFVQPGHCHDPLITCVNGYYYAHLCSTDDTLEVLKPDWAVHYTVSPSYHYVWQDSGYVNFGFIPDAVSDIQIKGISTGPVAIAGKESSLHVSYRNIGDTVTNTNLSVTIDSRLIFISASPAPSQINSNTFTWNLDTLTPLESGIVHIRYSVPSSLNSGTLLFYDASINSGSGDINPSDNNLSFSEQLMDSITPITKEVLPAGSLSLAEVQSSPVLKYTIRFQNTDTVTIANIRVTDSLSAYFMRQNFELLTASHLCQYQLDPSGLVTFTLSDIMLPDSEADEYGSYGHISYSVSLRNDLFVNDSILNRADVFYDFNEALATNTTVTIIDDPTSIEIKTDAKNLIFPNPATDNINLNISGYYFFEIFDVTGAQIKSGHTSGKIQISDVSPGLYLIKLSDEKGSFINSSLKFYKTSN